MTTEIFHARLHSTIPLWSELYRPPLPVTRGPVRDETAATFRPLVLVRNPRRDVSAGSRTAPRESTTRTLDLDDMGEIRSSLMGINPETMRARQTAPDFSVGEAAAILRCSEQEVQDLVNRRVVVERWVVCDDGRELRLRSYDLVKVLHGKGRIESITAVCR